MPNDKTYFEKTNPDPSDELEHTYSEILSLILSEKEKDQLVNQIENLSRASYKLNPHEALQVQEGIELRIAEILNTIPANRLSEFLTNLKEKINSLPVAKIVLSFNPTTSFVKKLHNLLSQGLVNGMVLDIKVDPEVIGGLTIELEGKFVDLTLRKKIDELILSR